MRDFIGAIIAVISTAFGILMLVILYGARQSYEYHDINEAMLEDGQVTDLMQTSDGFEFQCSLTRRGKEQVRLRTMYMESLEKDK